MQTLKFNFKARSEGGKSWIALEPADEKSNVLDDVSLTFNLPEGSTANLAEDIAAYLNKNIDSVSYATR
jgi:hypothetical protein